MVVDHSPVCPARPGRLVEDLEVGHVFPLSRERGDTSALGNPGSQLSFAFPLAPGDTHGDKDTRPGGKLNLGRLKTS